MPCAVLTIPVLVKNPVNPDVDLWQGAIERIMGAGLLVLEPFIVVFIIR
jgi:hypothetical protein